MALKCCTFFLIMLTGSITNAREIPTVPRLDEANQGNIMECWNALAEIKSCTNEIVAYFTIGTIDIDLPCCQAISVITHHCWPSMLSTLGFTPEETNMLRGYCDASASGATNNNVSSSSGPAPSPLLAGNE
ncbi:egg cell-secreted protein 1.4-like [Lycium barbarum]|uniref:egg cell-secreted protein 1.4-like n=1 Tax=Lycium barbarum TaxID=112863 RepID=UPI00293E5354|nr:egg cell-secreted protein 1.4-like [Lycium barbarum]